MISQSGDIKYPWHYLLMPLANESFRWSERRRQFPINVLNKIRK